MRIDLVSGRDDRLTLAQGPEGVIATLSGKADADFLTRVLSRLHDEALALQHAEVTLDLCRLEPLDPPAVKAVIRWAMRQAELEAHERYGITLLYSEGVVWQKVSLAAIGHLCPYVRLSPTA
jgi:hypothetical protein